MASRIDPPHSPPRDRPCDEAQQHEQDGADPAGLRVGRQQADRPGGDAHDRHGPQQRRAPAEPVAHVAEDRRADRAHDERRARSSRTRRGARRTRRAARRTAGPGRTRRSRRRRRSRRIRARCRPSTPRRRGRWVGGRGGGGEGGGCGGRGQIILRPHRRGDAVQERVPRTSLIARAHAGGIEDRHRSGHHRGVFGRTRDGCPASVRR